MTGPGGGWSRTRTRRRGSRPEPVWVQYHCPLPTLPRATCPPLLPHHQRQSCMEAQPYRSGRGRSQRRGRDGPTSILERRVNRLPPTSQTGAQTAGEGCWRCWRPGQFRRGQVIHVAGAPYPPHSPGEAYSILVRIQRGTYQALLDSGCMQTMIHQRLVRSEALVEASSVMVRCIHEDVYEYPYQNTLWG